MKNIYTHIDRSFTKWYTYTYIMQVMCWGMDVSRSTMYTYEDRLSMYLYTLEKQQQQQRE